MVASSMLKFFYFRPGLQRQNIDQQQQPLRVRERHSQRIFPEIFFYCLERDNFFFR